MNQAISYAGLLFTHAFFYYGAAIGNPFTGGGQAAVGLIEVVDDINITFAVPEPATTTLFMLGLAGLGLVRRQRRRY